MPLTDGSITCRIYKAELEADREAATLMLKRYAFRPIDDSRGERKSVGWVDPFTLSAENLALFDAELDGGAYLLCLRTDAKRPNGKLLKARIQKYQAETIARHKGAKLTKAQRQGIEEEATCELIRETQPSTSFVQLAWDVPSGSLIVGCAGDSACDRVVDFFEATFGVRLVPIMFPGVIAVDLAGEDFGSAEAIARYPETGSKFLDWLRRNRRAEILSPVTFDGDGEAKTVTVKGEASPVESKEAKAALALNKRIVKACLRFDNGETLTLDADRFDFRGYKPAVPKLAEVAPYTEARVKAVLAMAKRITDLCGEFLEEEGDK